MTAWLVAQTSGPASATPTAAATQRAEAPLDTAPQANAHIGANQVIGFSSSRTADGFGPAHDCETKLDTNSVKLTLTVGISLVLGLVVVEIAEPVAAQLGVKALAAEAEHLGGGGAVVAGQFERRLDAQALDQIGGLAHQVLQRHAADEFGEMLDGARQFAAAEPLAAGAPADGADRQAEAALAAVGRGDAGDLDVLA